MAAGDAVGDIDATIANDAYLPIQPGETANYCIHSIAHSGAAELYLTDGTNYLLLDSDSSAGSWINQTFFLTNTNYLAIKNKSGSTATLGYTGIQTK